MTLPRNHLMPTPIVDKNGKLTTVLKKPEHSSTIANALSLTPPLLATNTEGSKLLATLEDHLTAHSDIGESHGGANYWGVVKGNVEFLESDESEFLDFLNKITTTGTLQTKERTIAHVLKTLMAASIDHDMAASMEQDIDHIDFLKSGICGAWHISELIEEINESEHFYLRTRNSVIYKSHSEEGNADEQKWRGLAIFSYIEIEGYHSDFVSWADTRSDPKTIIAIAREWQTFDPAVIQEIIDQQQSVATSLHNGIL